jgi:hypothetical protein
MRPRFLHALPALVVLAGLTLVAWGQNLVPGAVRVDLAAGQKAKLPIILSEQASDKLKQIAGTFAEYLHKISGAKFDVQTGDGKTGIVLGLPEHFPALNLPALPDKKDPTKSEDYLLRSHAQGLVLLGTTDLAVQHAVWDLLYRLGHRQFFPGPTWEVIPKLDTITVALDLKVHPDYLARTIWYGYGTWDYNGPAYQDWCVRNRMAKGIDLHTGHAYDGILRRNADEVKKHPEYLGLFNGERKTTKFCVSNPDLRKLIVADTLKQFEAKPDLQSISLEPSDGGGWCQCDKCQAMGSVSNRALTLANDAAEALTAKYGDKFVGMYAYNEHSPPPTIKVHPRVIVSVATAFVRGGYTIDQLMEGWQKQGATLGVREYYSVHTWDRDLPGSARGARLNYIKTTIPAFHQKGVRLFSSESSDNWGPNGLGYYLASRILWNVKETDRWDALIEDFLDKAFGPAKEPMRKFYQLIDGSNRPLLSDDLIGRMYRQLHEARQKTSDPQVQERLNDLILYTRYVELFSEYSSSSGEARQKNFEDLIKHGYRMRKTMMIHTKALYRDLDNRDKSVVVPKEAMWSVPEAKNPWKNSTPFAKGELETILAEGIANRKLLDFTPVSFGENLVPARKLKLPQVKEGTLGIYYRGANNFLLWADKPTTLKLQAKGGIIYRDKGPAKFFLFPAAEPEGKEVSKTQIPPDKEEHPIELPTTFTGLHRLQISDGAAGTNILFPGDIGSLSVQSSPEAPFNFHGRWSMYFYVPMGTKVVGGFSSGQGLLRDGRGKEVLKFPTKPGYFSVPVEPGNDGTLWKFENSVGTRHLMTVPPFLARNGQELLLPKEVIDRDAN